MSIQVKYLANTAFLIKSKDHALLIDAFYDSGLPMFSNLPPEVHEKILREEGEYAGIDLVLVTHRHRDHGVARLLAEYGKHDVTFLVPEDMMNRRLEQNGRFIAIPPAGGEIWNQKGLVIQAVPTEHDGDVLDIPVLHFSYLLEFPPEGKRLLFLGDSRTDWGVFGPALAGRKIDLMALNFVEINQEKGRDFIRKVDAGSTLLCHLPLPEDDHTHMAKLAQRNLRRQGEGFVSCHVCDETGFTVELCE
ncbi:MAG: MBL fold metallo-hydrolase [Clostridia bacterium]|nr:MBL fold metallo-hydrolase [Clostridia bacterium]